MQRAFLQDVFEFRGYIFRSYIVGSSGNLISSFLRKIYILLKGRTSLNSHQQWVSPFLPTFIRALIVLVLPQQNIYDFIFLLKTQTKCARQSTFLDRLLQTHNRNVLISIGLLSAPARQPEFTQEASRIYCADLLRKNLLRGLFSSFPDDALSWTLPLSVWMTLSPDKERPQGFHLRVSIHNIFTLSFNIWGTSSHTALGHIS